MRDEPMVIGYLVRLALLSMTSKAVPTVCAYGKLSERQARSLFDTISLMDLPSGYERAMVTERVCGLDEMVKARSPRLRQYGNQAAYLSFMARQAHGAHLDYRDALSNRLFDSDSVPMYADETKPLALSFLSVNMARYFHMARLAETQVFLALQAYRDRFGAYPATLSELKSKLGWKFATDPFSGKDLVYRPQG
jgi:hypothetical protein